MADLKPGDFVLIQFGHNDGGPVDKEKYRGSLKGMGDEVQEVFNETTSKKETIHTFGWYMKKYALDAKNKGAKVILISPGPRNVWRNRKIVRASADYGLWAKESAKATGTLFLDLNEIVARQYEKFGQEKVGPGVFHDERPYAYVAGRSKAERRFRDHWTKKIEGISAQKVYSKRIMLI